MGAAGEIYKDGIGILLVIVGLIVGIMMVSKFVAPNFDRRFEGMISMGDIIEKFYGAKVEKWSVTIILQYSCPYICWRTIYSTWMCTRELY